MHGENLIFPVKYVSLKNVKWPAKVICNNLFSKRKSHKNWETGKIRVCKTLKYWDEDIDLPGHSRHLDLSMHNLEIQNLKISLESN